tara:strand:- start:175 stop:396 length:222 start_codon:yes stop_codon:yes gene_type:complete
MRKLTKQQIKILDFHKHINNVNDLSYEVWEELEQINDTEILYNEVDNYLQMNHEYNAPIKKWGKNQLNLIFKK